MHGNCCPCMGMGVLQTALRTSLSGVAAVATNTMWLPGVLQAADAKGRHHPAAAAAAAADPNGFKTPAAPKASTRVPGGAAAAGAAGNPAEREPEGDSPSLTIKVLDPVSTGGKAAAAPQSHLHDQHKAKHVQHAQEGSAAVGGTMGPPAPVGGKTPAAIKTPAASESEQVGPEAVYAQVDVAQL